MTARSSFTHALAVAVGLTASLDAQQAPVVAIAGAINRTAALQIAVDRPAFVTVFAVSRDAAGATLKVIGPVAPGSHARLEPRTAGTLRALSGAERLAMSRRGPIEILAFASETPPSLAAFADGPRFSDAYDVSGPAAQSEAELIQLVAQALYPAKDRYSAVVQSSGRAPSDDEHQAQLRRFADPCAGYDARLATTVPSVGPRRFEWDPGRDQLRLYAADPGALYTVLLPNGLDDVASNGVATIDGQTYRVVSTQLRGSSACSVTTVTPAAPPLPAVRSTVPTAPSTKVEPR
jgi:hypothetical protein